MTPETSRSIYSAGHSPTAVHRCRFVDYTPAAITAIAFPPPVLPTSRRHTPGRSQRKRQVRFGSIAVGRSNGNVELYEWAIPPHEQEHTVKAPQAWVLTKILCGPNPSKVDSLAFTLRYPHLLEYNEVPMLADLRLFSTGGGSELVEWDIASGTILRTLNSQGGAIWSMVANPAGTRLALGCEDGCVRLIDVSEHELSHIRRFDRTKSRILSIDWGPPTPPPMLQKEKEPRQTDDSTSDDEDEGDEWTDAWLVTGGSDSAIRKWDTKTGRVLDRMTTDKARGERTLVWTVGVLGDGTIVSGDSLGIVKFWDSRTCTQLHSFPAHSADVLCMTIGPDGNSIFTSGVDQKVCLFNNVRISQSDKADKTSDYKFKSRWVLSTSKRMHSHDVRALAIWPPHLPITASIQAAVASIPNPFSGVAPILASGGLDASLVLASCATTGTSDTQVNPLATSAVSTFEDAYHRRITYPTGHSSAISIARRARLLVCRRDTSLSVWRILGQARIPSALEANLRSADAMEVDSTASGSGAPMEQDNECGYEKLLNMKLDVVTNLSSSAVSDDGRWLAVSDAYEIKLFELIADSRSSGIRPRRVKSFMPIISAHLSPKSSSTEGPEGASALGFTPDGCRLVLATARSASLLVVDLTGRTTEGQPEPRVLRKFDHHARREALFTRGRVIREIPARPNGIPKVNGFSKSDASNESSDSEVDSASSDRLEMDGGENDEGSEHALVTRIAFSPDGQWFATTDDRYRTHIFNLDSVQHHTTLPTSPALVTAFAFLPPSPPSVQSGPLLVLAHADSTIGVIDVETRRFAPWAEHLAQREHLPRRWTNLHDSVLGMAVEPPSSLQGSKNEKDSGRHVLFWGATWLCRVELDAPVGWGGFFKKRRRDAHPVGSREDSLQASNSKSKRKGKNKVDAKATPATSGSVNPNISGSGPTANVQDDEETMSNFKLVTRYRPILKVDYLDAKELLVVERPLLDVLRNLPPAFFKPRYGT